MLESIITGVIAFAGSVVVALITSGKTRALIEYRLGKLEEEQKRHNNLMERVFIIEQDIKFINKKLEDK